MASTKTVYHFAPPQQRPHRGDVAEQTASPFFRQARNPAFSAADPSASTTPSFDRLVRPTWAEVDQAREQYETRARRLQLWQRWFVGMFTVYTTLVGILLLRLFLAP